MPIKKSAVWRQIGGLTLLTVLLIVFYPWLLAKAVEWQVIFNRSLSESLRQIQQHRQSAGFMLILLSFLYGLFHAVGPGHGKFIIAGYLATSPIKLKTSLYLTFFASLVQGAAAIAMVTVIVVGLQLSSRYFRLSQFWVERFGFLLMIALGGYWVIKSWHLYAYRRKPRKLGNIYRIRPLSQTALWQQTTLSHDQCGCGHQHIPSPRQLEKGNDWKNRLMIVFSIGARPCSGAIAVLFLAYLLDLYLWGMAAAMAMAVGTGTALSLFALLVLYARRRAQLLGRGYFSPQFSQTAVILLKVLFGLLLIGMGIALLSVDALPVNSGSALFGR
ncbi:hypothetical protein OA57_02120 [Chelonobacter oris]|uniref:Nickel/cobalt efflux system n=1 Tax=Chelonobacter oris TaxID=505317 RepID=A0A0A3AVD9_9PAST|nr:nickel/cobalt transporter [Chelonobacter oris]KGQ71055.1 hypothetical protein OA57_02120 [Chelonobacter oris]